MALNDLYDGVAIVIDDDIGTDGSKIMDLIGQIETKSVPCVKYTELPDLESIKHMDAISFLLLDWNLNAPGLSEEDTIEGVKAAATMTAGGIEENIEFLKALKEKIFAPIFIFTNEEPGLIIDVLKKHNLYQDLGQNSIFVKSKSELIKGKFFEEIISWLKQSTSVYVLKEWESEYKKAKNQLFGDFYKINPVWPNILWDNFVDDMVNPSSELGEVITKNLHTRMAPFAFDEEMMKAAGGSAVSPLELRTVLTGERFIENDRLDGDTISTGDVFKISQKFYVNIRPDCDCIPDRKGDESELDNVYLYLLKASPLTPAQEDTAFNVDYGHFLEEDSNSIIFCMYDGKTFKIGFKNLLQEKWGDIKGKRKGRLLPPYINRIQQRYGNYLKRQGLPRTPKEAIGNSAIKSESADKK